eukprot:6979909-Alexandrium_andersonii.AAC.1
MLVERRRCCPTLTRPVGCCKRRPFDFTRRGSRGKDRQPRKPISSRSSKYIGMSPQSQPAKRARRP